MIFEFDFFLILYIISFYIFCFSFDFFILMGVLFFWFLFNREIPQLFVPVSSSRTHCSAVSKWSSMFFTQAKPMSPKPTFVNNSPRCTTQPLMLSSHSDTPPNSVEVNPLVSHSSTTPSMSPRNSNLNTDFHGLDFTRDQRVHANNERKRRTDWRKSVVSKRPPRNRCIKFKIDEEIRTCIIKDKNTENPLLLQLQNYTHLYLNPASFCVWVFICFWLVSFSFLNLFFSFLFFFC